MEFLKNPEFYKELFGIFIISIALAYFIYILYDTDLSRKRIKYEATLKNAISSGKINNEDIYTLAERWLVKKEKISLNLYFILSDYLNEKDCDDEKLNRIREIIIWHQEQNPFSDLPDDIKLQLQRLQGMASNCRNEILQLSKSLSEIYLSNQRRTRREQIVSRISLLVGIVGVMYGFFS